MRVVEICMGLPLESVHAMFGAKTKNDFMYCAIMCRRVKFQDNTDSLAVPRRGKGRKAADITNGSF